MKVADLPPRVVLAAAVTVLAVVVLAAQTVLSDRDGGDAGATTTTIEAPGDTVDPDDEPVVVAPTPVEVQPDWYPKRSSRYSDRIPEASVTTVPTQPGA